jgi:hypothetical protein
MVKVGAAAPLGGERGVVTLVQLGAPARQALCHSRAYFPPAGCANDDRCAYTT